MKNFASIIIIVARRLRHYGYFQSFSQVQWQSRSAHFKQPQTKDKKYNPFYFIHADDCNDARLFTSA